MKFNQKFTDLPQAKFCSSVLQEYPQVIKSAALNRTHFPRLYIKFDLKTCYKKQIPPDVAPE
jgi:hypothetical protein